MAIGRMKVIGQAQSWLEERPELTHWMNVLRLGLFQFGMGLSLAPLTGTLNRVLIDELNIPAVAVGLLLALHFFVSPARAVIGFHSDQSRAQGKWRTPYLVLGAMLTYGGLATAPFSLILLGGNGVLPFWMAFLLCALIFLAYGIGVNIVETIYLALVSDITPPRERGRVLAILWTMLVLGTIVSSIIVGQLLIDYSHMRLIQVMQGSAMAFVALTFASMLGQERLKANGEVLDFNPEAIVVRETLGGSIRKLIGQPVLRNLFVVLFLATLAFGTHDVLLEPYGGQVLAMSVTATTRLTAFWGVAMLLAIGGAGMLLWRGRSPLLLIGLGIVAGALGFLSISLATDQALLPQFYVGIWLIGMGRGLFIVGSLALIMALVDGHHAGLFLGLWGVVQALAQGFGVIGGGLARDLVQHSSGNVALGYTIVYQTAAVLLLAALALVFALRLGQRLKSIRSPWAGLGQVNADQIIFGSRRRDSVIVEHAQPHRVTAASAARRSSLHRSSTPSQYPIFRSLSPGTSRAVRLTAPGAGPALTSLHYRNLHRRGCAALPRLRCAAWWYNVAGGQLRRRDRSWRETPTPPRGCRAPHAQSRRRAMHGRADVS
ncbi:BCD family MFS transporter [Candidatus Gracilibacteria bacterium]|nr:BCD family MFS transporter [Candidatus Gracilibacteria bacterium]